MRAYACSAAQALRGLRCVTASRALRRLTLGYTVLMPLPEKFAGERAAALFALLALGLAGCGDGVGEPIRKDASLGGATPDKDYCRSVQEWDASAARDEQDVATFLNSLRSWGVDCSLWNEGTLPGATRSGGMWPGTAQEGTALTPLAMSPELRCSARLHSRDMAERQTVFEISPEGETPELRMRKAGYPLSAGAEVALEVPVISIQLSLFSAEYCAKVMDPDWVAVGVGKFQDYWTVDLAAKPEP
jgi:hypothetical protein